MPPTVNVPDTSTEVRPERTPPDPITIEDLPEGLRKAASAMGWTTLMPVQEKTIPYLRADRDLMVQSRTGSGKTGAFVLPILEKIDLERAVCQAVVLVPTRELARQVCEEAEKLSLGSGVRALPIYGGVAYGPQLDGLKKGAHVVVGTPGRILDHLMRGTLKLDKVKVFIMDEADRMLSMGFYPDMIALRSYLPQSRASHMFSATYPFRVKSLASQFLRDPEFVSLSEGAEHVATTAHIAYEVPTMEKNRHLVRIIEVENPDSAIIFVNTRDAANFVTVVLQRFGYDADQLSANLSQGAREEVLKRVYDKKLRFLVATDVAARGIDVESLSHVFLYDFPEDPESYIHRTGRTGRAGASGIAIALCDVMEIIRLGQVEKRYGFTIERRPLPSQEDLAKVVAERAIRDLEAKRRGLDNLVRERLQRMMPLARRLAEDDDELELLAMLLDEYYQKLLHDPPAGPPPPGELSLAEQRGQRERQRETLSDQRGRGGDRDRGRGGGSGAGRRRRSGPGRR
jgi:ATP-dependent RNA helicase DeaD